MKFNILGVTGERVSSIGLGTWVFGGHFWGGANEQDCINAVHAAIDGGINLIDTAPIYSRGDSERIVGKAITNRRDKVFLATKCGLSLNGHEIVYDLSASAIKNEVEGSLRRLKTDYIDLYQCHWPDDKTNMQETFATMDTLKQQGKIRYIGVSNYGSDRVQKAMQFSDIKTSQDQYSILDISAEEELLQSLKDQNVQLLAYGALAGGILTGKYDHPPTFKEADARNVFYKYYSGKAFDQVKELLASLREIKQPLNQVAINWVRQQPGVLSVLVGARNPNQVGENIKSVSWDLSSQQLEFIRNVQKETVYD